MIENEASFWQDKLPQLTDDMNKYDRGFAVVYGGPMTGAARLASLAARRAGVGMLVLVSFPDTYQTYAQAEPGMIVKQIENVEGFSKIIEDERVTALLVGPGAGVNEITQHITLAALETGKPCILDADALSVFESNPEDLMQMLHENCVLTPHEGEFARIFSVTGSREERIKAAAQTAGCTVLLKSHETLVADTTGQVVVNTNAPATLATAGSGDILAGLITSLIAQGMSVFDAACAGAYIHGETAQECGAGLIAEDLIVKIPKAIAKIKGSS